LKTLFYGTMTRVETILRRGGREEREKIEEAI
jgi:hypothetical protein